MIRFRIGQRWKREDARAPHDAFALELDGVDLLGRASEEPLAQVVPELVATLHALAVEGAALGQVSLAEAHLELCLARREAAKREAPEIDIAVVRLGRPAGLERPFLRVDLQDLVDATVRCGRDLARDLSEAAPALAQSARIRRMLRQLTGLERAAPVPLERRFAQGGLKESGDAPGPVGFGFELSDPDDRLLALDKDGAGALTSLLARGALELKLGDATAWRAEGTPILAALELSRQAAELAHALEVNEREYTFAPGGLGPELRVELQARTVEAVGGGRAGRAAPSRGTTAGPHPVEPAALVRAMFELPLALTFALTGRHKAQARNPYVTELIARCREGLSQLREPVEPAATPPARPRKRAKAGEGKPLTVPGRLRRLRFEPLWTKHGLAGEEPGSLLLGSAGPIFSSPQLAAGFSPSGALRFQRVATHGVAVTKDGELIAADATRVLGFGRDGTRARWLRDHDGLPLGPRLIRRNGLLITLSEGRAAVAFAEVTGREQWRAAPPRAHQLFLCVHGHRVLLATDAGHLHGLDLADGQFRYRVRAALPFIGDPVPWGKRVLAPLGRRERYALCAADAHTGSVHWTEELTLSLPSRPLPLGQRVVVAGERDGDGVLICLNARGQKLWERALHLGHGRYALLAIGRSILVASQSGAAARIDADGRVEWRVGAAGEPVACAISPVIARRLLFLPGERVRAVDPRGGGVLAEVEAGLGLCDLAVDAKLNLYLLDEHGGLAAHRLSTHLAVVGQSG